MANDAYILQGGNGGKVIADTNANTGSWSIVQVVNDAVIDNISSSLVDVGGLSGLTLPAGTIIGGRTTEIQLTSGAVIVYNT